MFNEIDTVQKSISEEYFELDARHKMTDFIKVKIDIDMTEAKRRYELEWDNDIDGTSTCQQSFYQWLSCKEYEAMKFYIETCL